MSRFKFRFWDQSSGVFRENLHISNHGHCTSSFRPDPNDCHNCHRLSHPIENIITQQWIGLVDKNGVDIYEGDKVVFDNSDIGGERYVGFVEWNSDQTLDNLCWGIWVPNGGWLHCDFLGEIEVIGNIFEGDH